MSGDHSNMLNDEELASFHGVFKNNHNLIEIDCGCTIPKYGDTPGRLRIYADGKIEVDCICTENCSGVNLSPVEFAKHVGRSNAHHDWKRQIWVFKNDGTKVPLWRTCLLRYHTDTFQRPLREVAHRDEFVKCSVCSKERRFSLRSIEACRTYHEALVAANWKCSDMPYYILTCNDDEERESRKVCRGCPRSAKCKGCENCICFGCDMCRFADCPCNTCVEFIQNI